ncbi:MAG: hypothetical protein ABFD77_05735 [Thermotogota bacterium]
MNKAALRPVIFEILRRTPQTHLHAIETEIRQRVDGYARAAAVRVHEVVWDLLVQGVLAPGKNSLNLHLPFVHVTEYGAQSLEEGAALAHDPDAYVAKITEESGRRASPVVVESGRDAQLAYSHGLYRVVVLLLARAADDVRAALAIALSKGSKHDAEQATAPSIEALRRALARLELPADVARDIDPQLGGLETVILLSRNRDGTPHVPAVDRDRALAFLLLFPGQCGFVYHLIDRIEREREAES